MTNRKKVLFIDRDGTLIVEPVVDQQVDSLEKLEFIPKVFQALASIVRDLDYELVMVTNQDGLGTTTFPEDTFWPAHNFMMKSFENEGIRFSEILIDRTRPEDKAPTRKPGTAMLTHYIRGNYNLEESFVIGDRQSDLELAENLGAKSICFAPLSVDLSQASFPNSSSLISDDWMEIYQFLKNIPRTSSVKRRTNETDIEINLGLDGPAGGQISTGLAFFDHMLQQISRHGNFKLDISVKGDLEIDEHHTIEDTGIALGDAFRQAVGQKKGIGRYAFVLPMDDSLAQVALDFGGRSWLEWDVQFKREKIGDVPTEMFVHFFKSFCDEAKCNLNIQASAQNEHHLIESIFKAFAKCLDQATRIVDRSMGVPSSKGIL